MLFSEANEVFLPLDDSAVLGTIMDESRISHASGIPCGYFYIGVLLLANGFLKSLKFGEAYLSDYLNRDKGISYDQINNSVYPIWTYSYLFFLVIMSFSSAKLGYFNLMLIEGACEIATYGLLSWYKDSSSGVSSLRVMQLMQFIYGLASASAFGYYSAVGENFPAELQTRWNAYLRGIILAGHVVASLAAQGLLNMSSPISMHWLFVASFISLCPAFFLILFLPQPKSSTAVDLVSKEEEGKDNSLADLKGLFGYLWERMVQCYRKTDILLWTVLWALLYGMVTLAEGYGTSVWSELGPKVDGTMALNGVMDAVGRAVGVIGCFLISIIPNVLYERARMPALLSVLGASIGLFSLSIFSLAYFSSHKIVMILAWICMIGLGYSMTTLISGILLLKAPPSDHGFMIGSQTFLAILIQTILQLAISETGWSFSLVWRYYTMATISAATLLVVPFLACSEFTQNSTSLKEII